MLAEDPPDDLGLAVMDLDPAAYGPTVLVYLGHGVIAVWHAARGEPCERSAFESAERLVAKIVEVGIRYQALDGVGELGTPGARGVAATWQQGGAAFLLKRISARRHVRGESVSLRRGA